MTWFFAFLIVVVMGVVAVVASGRGGSMAETYDDRPDSRVQADGPLTAADLRSARFSTAFRGYRMSEVDSLLDRLAAEMTPVPMAGPADTETVPDDTEPPGAERPEEPRPDDTADPADTAAAPAQTEATDAPLPDEPRHRDSLLPDDGRR
jgi:DivIVA domain-containing protein